ncbi:hypothetical protein LIER_33309 [Lithospermum erythrorhizon]|uniref:Aminotransferase-like plant mobile domain-containing protein n=1 Tax=Lithospermum erythrorhizon TaxID=34254 RepID=A0AAV3RW99_LITER
MFVIGLWAWHSSIALHGQLEYASGYWECAKDVLSRCSAKLSTASIYEVVCASLFTYEHSDTLMKAFVEYWSPSTNTLLLPHGKASISLWDTYKLGGLPVARYLMDEVVPLAECMSPSLGKSDRIPEWCRFLLYAYHHLASSSSDRSISPAEWISFWSALPQGYRGPLIVEGGRAGSLPCCPHGHIPAHGSLSVESLLVFKLLKIPSSLSDEVYYAAFLSCWPYIFVLPLDVSSSICPSLFKMASWMAAGNLMSLAIPIRASIYRGLHLITTARYPSNSSCYFPVHYLLGWICSYLRTYKPMKRSPPGLYMVRCVGVDRCKGKSSPRLPSPPVPSSSKPLKKRSIPEDALVDRDPRHAKWGSTKRPDPIVVSSPDAPAAVTKDIEATPIVPSSRDEAQVEVVDVPGPLDRMITEVADIEVPATSLPTGIQHIESILRDSLKVALVELCSVVEGKSYEILLEEEQGIMASFEAFTRFSRQDLSSQDKELKVIFPKAIPVRDAQCRIVLPEVHDRFVVVRTASTESSSKFHHETEAIGSICTTLKQSEERAARLR